MSYLKDFATSLVATPPSPAISGLSLSVTAAEATRLGDKFPYNATVCPEGELPTLDNAESVRVTGRVGDQLTIVRAQNGTEAKPIAAGWRISNVVMAADIDPRLNVMDFGAKVDGRRIKGVTCTSASASVTVPNGAFTSADVGKMVLIYNDTTPGTIRTIQSVTNATTITLSGNAGITLTNGGYIMYGTDDSAAVLAAAEAAVEFITGNDETLGDNQPKILGRPRVYIPAAGPIDSSNVCCIGTAITIPEGIIFDSEAMLANFISDRYEPFLIFGTGCRFTDLYAESLFGSGIQLGTSGDGADIEGRTLRLWHVGKEKEVSGALRAQTGLDLFGYSFSLDEFWCKGGWRGLNCDNGSDLLINRAIIIGAKQPVKFLQTNQVKANFIFDSCGDTTPAEYGLMIDDDCNNMTIDVQAFEVAGVSRGMLAIVGIGTVSNDVNRSLNINIRGQRTGGAGIQINYAQELDFIVNVSNSDGPINEGQAMTTAVEWGTGNLGAISGIATMSGTIAPYTGTPVGSMIYNRGGQQFRVQAGSAGTIAAEAANGTTPATPTVAGNDSRGTVNFGSGTTPTAGSQVTVTFASATVYPGAPRIFLTPLNAATATRRPYVAAVTATGFTVGFADAPAASQAAGTYSVAWRAEL